jgi:hypothetical protein
MDPAEITQIKDVVTHQGLLLGRQLTNSLQPQSNLNPGGANVQVSSPRATGIAVAPPGNLHQEPKIPAPERCDGHPGGCKGFLTQCSLVFELQSSSFHTDQP